MENNNVKCLYCNSIYNLNGIFSHVTFCKKGPRGNNALLEAYEYYNKLDISSLINDYKNDISGKDLVKKYNVTYRIINIIFEKYSIQKRTTHESQLIAYEKSKIIKGLRYGNPLYSNFEKIKETKKNRYGDAFFSNRAKNRKTCQDRYGVDNVFQTKDVIEKIKKRVKNRIGLLCAQGA